MNTPWGRADDKTVYGPGIVFYSTPSHGGFKISKAQNEKIHPAYRNADGWYEEDCEALKVIFTFPQFFSDRDFVTVCRGLAHWYPEQTKTVENDTAWIKAYLKPETKISGL